MENISTKNLKNLLDIEDLKNLCKSISVLDAIICPEWEYRYYSYNRKWSVFEEYFEMRNGSGDYVMILFNREGAVINGMAHESVMSNKIGENVKIWDGVVDDIDQVFDDFIFEEPVKSIGTTFCIWKKYSDSNWNVGDIKYPDNDYFDGSGELMKIFDGKPETYRNWALSYFEIEDLNEEMVSKIYNGNLLTKEMVFQINQSLKDLERLKADLDEIGYEHTLH